MNDVSEKLSTVKSPEEKILEILTKTKGKFTEKDWEQVHKEREEH